MTFLSFIASRPFLGHIQVLQGVTQKRTNAQVFSL